jgi:hypothetical protein
MIKFKLAITLNEKKHELETNTVELIAAERHFGKGSATMFTEEEWHFEYVVFLAYKAMTFRKLFSGTFDEFIEANPDIDMVESGDAHPLDSEQVQSEPVSNLQ